MEEIKASFERLHKDFDMLHEVGLRTITSLGKEKDEAEKKVEELEGEVVALRAELVQAERKKAEKEDIEMGGIGSSSPETIDAATNTEKLKTMVGTATNTGKRSYAQAVVRTQVGGKGKGPKTPAVTSEVSGGAASPLQRFSFVEDLSEYEEEETER